jgi:hypothetical protein
MRLMQYTPEVRHTGGQTLGARGVVCADLVGIPTIAIC